MTTDTTRRRRRSPRSNIVQYPDLGYLEIGKPMNTKAWQELLQRASDHFYTLADLWGLGDEPMNSIQWNLANITGILARARNHYFRPPPGA